MSRPTAGVRLDGELLVPAGATGLVVFAHGSGSSRKSPPNTFVAEVLRRHGLGTLLFDLLTEREDATYETRFDVDLLTDRLLAATDWLGERADTRDLIVGYFGPSTGAAAALRAAADHLDRVTVATPFVVGGADTQVLERNRTAFERLAGPKELRVVEGAGHLFEGPGELETVAELAADWFGTHLE